MGKINLPPPSEPPSSDSSKKINLPPLSSLSGKIILPSPLDSSDNNSDNNTSYAEKLQRQEEALKQHANPKDVARFLGDKGYKNTKSSDKPNLFSTPHTQKAFDRISTNTLPTGLKIRQKKHIVTNMLEQKLIPEKVLKSPTIYIGGGADIEYPLSLGCKNITITDPALSQEKTIEKIINKVEAITGKKPDINFSQKEMRITDISFKFNFRPDKNELVTTHFDPNPFTSEADIPPDIGMILTFATPVDIEKNEKITKKLIQDGIIVDFIDLYQKKDDSLRKIKEF